MSFTNGQILRATPSPATLGIPIDNGILILERTGPVDLKALEQSVRELTRRHTTLRTAFPTEAGTPVQLVTVPLAAVALTELNVAPGQQDTVEAARAIREEAGQPFDLLHGPLMRVRLLRLLQDHCILVVTVHALAADEWSLHILANELSALYEAYSTGTPASLAEVATTYTDSAHSQASRLQGDHLEHPLSYWRKRLAGLPPALEIPAERPQKLLDESPQAYQTVVFSNSLRHSLKLLSEQEGTTLFTALLAGFQSLLSRYTNQVDITVGSVVSARGEVGTEYSIGPFSRTVLTRTDVSGDPTFRTLLGRVRDAVRRDSEYQDVALDQIIREIEPERDPVKDPLFRILVSSAPSISSSQSPWRLASIEVGAGEATTDLQVQFQETPDGILTRFRYNSDLFDSATVTRMAGHLQTLLEGIVASPDQPLSTLPILTDAERHQLLGEWNDTFVEYPQDRCVHQLFEEQTNRTPDNPAVLCENRELSYRELNARANQLAHHLLKLGLSPGALVGICVDRSAEMVAALLGILKAGGAYVPLDPQYPWSRLSLMLEDSGLAVLVTEERLRSKFSAFHGHIVCLDSKVIREESEDNCLARVNPESLAYVIYTSGSTGKPKGVAIPHRALVNFLFSMRTRPGLTANDTLLAVTTISFDIAALELYLPLVVGARLALTTRGESEDGSKLQEVMVQTAATVMQATPATWRLLLEAGWQGSADLKILCGGEPLPRDLVKELLKRSAALWNMYGPTETTVWSTIAQITFEDNPITIGRPIANTEIYLLDSGLQPVPVGIPGELYIGGDGLARGYLHQPELTNARFISHPFRERNSGARLYKTGDLARYRAGGDIVCLGRMDNQVKLRGFRIELGEIESVLADHPGVQQNVVIAREDAPGGKRLIAYVVADEGHSPATAGELRGFLKNKLPDYMLPAEFVFLKSLPLTPNGKLDRRALPKPEECESVPRQGRAVPRDNVESRLMKIWTSVLGSRSIGIDENFFELGGHSLLIAKLIRRIDEAFGRKLSMAEIFEAPTIEQQAVMIRSRNILSLSSAIVPIQSGGSRDPLFCFGLNSGPVYLRLARHLGTDQPLLCVGPTQFEVSQLSPPYQLESIVACLIKRIRERQPNGPYYLAGMCQGGLIAYEAARQLTSQGQQVALLALFEPQIPARPARHAKPSKLALCGRKMRFHFDNLKQLDRQDVPRYIRERFFRGFALHIKGLQLRMRKNDSRLQDLVEILYFACTDYRPGTFPGRITLFQAANRLRGSDWEIEYWRRLAAKLEMHVIPGYSNWVSQCFVEPNVSPLAEKLKDCLARCALSQPAQISPVGAAHSLEAE